jgi:hypothetical protein
VHTPNNSPAETVLNRDVHLCSNKYFDEGPRVRAEILIHECAHLIGMSVSTDDIYRFTQRFRGLSQELALLNSDSYALFASGASQGIPLSVPISFGVAGGVVGGSPTGESGWFASVYAETTFEHPRLHLFNPTLRLSMTFMGVPESARLPEPGRGYTLSSDTSLIFGLLPGIRIEDPRPSGRGTGYFALRGGPTYNIRGTEGGFGGEVGVAVGYHWRWLDIGLGASYNRDPTAREGARDLIQFGPTVSFSPGPLAGHF